MPVQAFVDDSGGKGQSRHFVLSGLISDSQRWALFSQEWRACLDRTPRIGGFKMREAASRTGAFHRFTEEERDGRLRSLAQIINRHVEFAIWTMIDLEAHAQTWAKLPKPKSEVYFWPFHTLILCICFDLWEECRWREPFEITFDEQLIFGERARRWYPLVKEIVRLTHPEEFSILPTNLLSGRMTSFWRFRRRISGPGACGRTPTTRPRSLLSGCWPKCRTSASRTTATTTTWNAWEA